MIPSQLTALLSRRRALSHVAALSFGVLSLLVACTTTPKAKETKECQPGNYVFCRCRDRQEGTKLCKDDGQSFGPCEPCESYDNPEGDLEPGDPGFEEPDLDAGNDDEGGPKPAGECGDGVVDTGEDCDDDNTNETDGCDSKCKLAGATPSATNACPGLEVHVWGGAHKPTLASTTVGSGNRTVNSNCPTSANPTARASAADRVFKVTAHKAGTLNVVTSDVSYNVLLWASEKCEPGENAYITCVNESGEVAAETMTFPVDDGKTYYVFVDGAGVDKREGNFRVTFSIP